MRARAYGIRLNLQPIISTLIKYKIVLRIDIRLCGLFLLDRSQTFTMDECVPLFFKKRIYNRARFFLFCYGNIPPPPQKHLSVVILSFLLVNFLRMCI